MAEKKTKQRKKPARKRARKRTKKKGKKAVKRKTDLKQVLARRTAAEEKTQDEAARKVGTTSGPDDTAAVVETHEDVVKESVPASVVHPAHLEDTRDERHSLRIFENNTPIEAEVATRAAGEPVVPGSEAESAAWVEGSTEAETPPAPGKAGSRQAGSEAPAAHELSPEGPEAEELSPEEALAMLADISGRLRKVGAGRQTGAARRPRPVGSVIMPSCKVIAFETAAVQGELRVAGSTMARLYTIIHEEGLDLELGRVCQTVDELIDEWDSTPVGQTVVLLVNLIGAEGFLEEFLSEVPEVVEAYWIVYETLRGEVTSSKNEFLTEQRAKGRAKAVGFGPRNIVAAARTAAEAVRWRVTWGFAKGGPGRFAAKAS